MGQTTETRSSPTRLSCVTQKKTVTRGRPSEKRDNSYSAFQESYCAFQERFRLCKQDQISSACTGLVDFERSKISFRMDEILNRDQTSVQSHNI